MEWLDSYLLSKPGVSKDYKAEWDWWRYQVGGKLFAAVMHPSEKYAAEYAGKDIINLKSDPLLAELYRKEFAEVLPAFYMDKRCWNSILLDGNLSQEFLRQLCDDSYKLVFDKLTKKLQKEIMQSE